MRAGLVLSLLGVLYLAGLLPGLAWGDGALFQKKAALMELSSGGLAHPHYVIVARPFTRLPGIPAPLGVTLLSTLSTLGALALLYATLRATAVAEVPALAAVVATGAAHLVWFHAVIPEVYPLATLLHAGVVTSLVRHHHTDRGAWLFLAALLLGFALGVHLLAVVPGFFFIGYVLFRRLPPRELLRAGAAFVVGAAPYGVLLASSGGPATSGLAEAAGGPFLSAWRPANAPMGLAILAGAWVYSFPPLAGLFGLWGLAKIVRARPVLGPLVVATILFQIALVAPFRVKDAPVFLLPGAWMFGIGIGFGLDRFLAQRARGKRVGAEAFLVLTFLLVPAVVYSFAPGIVRNHLAERESPIEIAGRPLFRVLPGRDDVAYALFPPKAGMGSRGYAEAAAQEVPPGSLVIADWTLLTPLLYLQEVEGRFPNVLLEEIPRAAQADRARAAIAEGRRVFFAATEPAYYDLDGFAEIGVIRAAGPMYGLDPRP